MSDSNNYIVRRLTPLECCRLQGFPDDYATGIDLEENQENMMWGRKVLETYNEAICKKNKVTDGQVKRFITTSSDANQYKMWGNGVALPCVDFVLGCIADEVKNDLA